RSGFARINCQAAFVPLILASADAANAQSRVLAEPAATPMVKASQTEPRSPPKLSSGLPARATEPGSQSTAPTSEAREAARSTVPRTLRTTAAPAMAQG